MGATMYFLVSFFETHTIIDRYCVISFGVVSPSYMGTQLQSIPKNASLMTTRAVEFF